MSEKKKADNDEQTFLEEIQEEDDAIKAEQQSQIDELLGIAVEPTPEDELEGAEEPEEAGEGEEEGEPEEEEEAGEEEDLGEPVQEDDEEPGAVSKTEEAGGEEEEDPESAESLKQQIAAMRKRLEEYATGTETKLEPTPEKPVQSEPKKADPPKQETQTVEPQEFVSVEEFQRALRSPQELNKLLNKVHSAGMQSVMQTVPQLVNTAISRQLALKQARDRFYAENPDLEKHQQYVGFVTNRVIAANPELGLDEALAKVAAQVREDLALSIKAREAENVRTRSRQTKPVFAGKKGSRSRKAEVEQDLTDQQSQMAELINLDV